MKDFYIADAARFENQVITSSFVVASKQAKPKKSGELYLSLTLVDRTGQLDAKMWDNVSDFINVFDQDDFVKVRGLLNKFNGRFQLTLHKLRSMQDAEVEFDDYLPRTTKDIGRLWQTVADFVEGFRNPYLKQLVKTFMADPQIERAYKNAPAAKTLHHAYIGGLLDHVVSLFQICDLASRNYPGIIDRDLLLTGAFLHDIGKVHELSFARSFTYTTRGQLLGHMIIELEMLQEKIVQVPGFPAEYKTLLEHLIISHHGKYEFGSPKMPMFPEALMLHYLDDLDSKMESMRAHFEREPGAEWTSYNVSLERPLLNTQRFLAKLKEEAASTPCASAVAASAGDLE
ncbi:MAG TPA: OB-fold nucleic acid binding domain-containing protein [Candidatus Angelobacter sp.]|nr:MAG: phosphohydrolase [Candidatus Angelobacter sp. Gp1-AA117]HMC29907.1 OB-fold nucleic acid binding domain-containing protein [Candidatus Angelobacter sp.]